MADIETANDCGVAIQGDMVMILLPSSRMTKERALRLAAWLVTLADPTEEAFPWVLQAVRNT